LLRSEAGVVAVRRAERTAPIIDDIRAQRKAGLFYAAIAKKLNEQVQLTVNGKAFTAMAVHRQLN